MSNPSSSSNHPPPHHSNDPLVAGRDATATASHPFPAALDPTTSAQQPVFSPLSNASQGGQSAATTSSSAELSRLKVKLKNGLRQFPDFPEPGILFEDIVPLFASHELHQDLITALELQVAQVFSTTIGEKSEIDVIVGLESRGFLFGPTLALRLGASFVPVRKKGKLPGECLTESYKKEYGEDHFQMQSDAIKPGQKVVVVDDIIATGGTAAAAGNLVQKLGGKLLGFVFMMELDFLKGRDKLNAPVHTLFSGQ